MQSSKEMIWRQSTLIRSVRLSDGITQNLLLTGCVFRPKRQCPVVDGEHAQKPSSRMIYGSVRNLRIDRGQLLGDLRWASDPASQKIRAKYESGMLTFRLDVDIFAKSDLLRGQRLGTFTGPCSVVTRWQPMVVSLVAAGET